MKRFLYESKYDAQNATTVVCSVGNRSLHVKISHCASGGISQGNLIIHLGVITH
jgi:hypothetical protein